MVYMLRNIGIGIGIGVEVEVEVDKIIGGMDDVS